ncbi:MAG: phosphodiesterase [Bdellovibrionales bacterium]|nr:phosphodiesterase [Bdellovibrionales bacterium]MBT3527163.1 phosphodiesterase [Bdellovibrionales bacterium]MBT7670034.1 phosphodiesterase [Bdellovibrionales bacterium]
MLVAHISDSHVAEYGKKAYGLAPTSEYFEKCIKHMNSFEPKIDLVLITGDICGNPTPGESRRAADILSTLKIPYYTVPGNHDTRDDLLKYLPKSCPTELDGFIQYTVEDYDLRVIALDSVTEGMPGGTLCKKRLDWLDAKLAEQPQRPTMLMLHHPPIKYGVHETDTDGFIGSEEFGDVVEKYSNITRVLCGHVHMSCHAGWRNTVISTTAAIGMQLVLDLTLKKDSAFSIQPPSYQLHYHNADGEIISNVIPVRGLDTPGPFMFEEYLKVESK